MEGIVIAVSLLVVGLVLLAVEGFILPGFGVAGIGGILLIVGGCFLAWRSQGWEAGLAAIGVSVALTVAGMWFVARSHTARGMVLEHHNPGESADTAGLRRLVGRTGVTTSDLRPAGTAEIDGERYQVTSGGDWIPADTPVRVTRVGTFSLFVEIATPETVAALGGANETAAPAGGPNDQSAPGGGANDEAAREGGANGEGARS